ncbi:uncharacterized protein ARMOST_04248 [Armillaria ostoyae]|uniref:Uncharacterized protein n=1 Tax=Armillaria ostoyae TaxID=47428 RepID=A0A284QWU2_ARMOS|nr:uncharacterized protein ARMOST_04248 [Armillaria ostoyae]
MKAAILVVLFAVLSVLAQSNESVSVNYDIIVFPAFQALDVFGPLHHKHALLRILTQPLHHHWTLDPKPQSSQMNSADCNFNPSYPPIPARIAGCAHRAGGPLHMRLKAQCYY